MALPLEEDPRRPLRLAIRLCVLLSILFGIPSLLFGYGTVVEFGTGGRIWPRIAGALLVVLLPAVLYTITAINLSRGRQWAVVVGLVTASLQLLCLGGAFILTVYFLPGALLPYLLILVCALALLQLVAHLKRSARVIRLEMDQQQRGFEVLPIVRAAPIEKERVDEK